MTQCATDTSYPAEHEEIWEMLPWYVNGTLDDRERASTASGLSSARKVLPYLAKMTRQTR
jgi:hypothetical protein